MSVSMTRGVNFLKFRTTHNLYYRYISVVILTILAVTDRYLRYVSEVSADAVTYAIFLQNAISVILGLGSRYLPIPTRITDLSNHAPRYLRDAYARIALFF